MALVLFLGAFCAMGGTVTYNTLATGGNGFYNGDGGVDGGFTTVTAGYGDGGTLGLSLRLMERGVGLISPIGLNDYSCGAGKKCNVDFGVSTSGGLHLSDFAFSLTFNDVTTKKFLTFDPTLLDNSYWQAGSKTMIKDLANQTGMQNSEYLGFGFLATPLGYTAGDKLSVTLSASAAGAQSSSVEIFAGTTAASAVPEPATYAMMGLGLAGLAFIRRRKSVKK